MVSAMFYMYGGVTVIVSREILTNNVCKRLLYISILMQVTGPFLRDWLERHQPPGKIYISNAI